MKDMLPTLPSLREVAGLGCRLCRFIRDATLEQGIVCTTEVTIEFSYCWRGHGDGTSAGLWALCARLAFDPSDPSELHSPKPYSSYAD